MAWSNHKNGLPIVHGFHICLRDFDNNVFDIIKPSLFFIKYN